MDGFRLAGIYSALSKKLADREGLYLVGSVEEQRLFLCEADRVMETYPASTSRLGVGIREDSLKTPPGLHRVCEKIGSGAPLGRVFRDRRDTGTDWDGVSREDNLILSRILRLEGLDEGINRGPGVDSRERYIYIHGTNREDLVGTPFTHGCHDPSQHRHGRSSRGSPRAPLSTSTLPPWSSRKDPAGRFTSPASSAPG